MSRAGEPPCYEKGAAAQTTLYDYWQSSQGGQASSSSGLTMADRVRQYEAQGLRVTQRMKEGARAVDKRNYARDLLGEDQA